jgi:MFS family permease
MLVASRTIQGIGGGGLLTLVEVIMTDMVPIAEIGAFMGIITPVWATGSVLGIMNLNYSNKRTNDWRFVRRSWTLAIRAMWYVMIPLAGFGLVISFLSRD